MASSSASRNYRVFIVKGSGRLLLDPQMDAYLARQYTFSKVFSADTHGMAVTADGELVAWGLRSAGFLGDGYFAGSSLRCAPAPVGRMEGKVVRHVAMTRLSTVVLADGLAYTCGRAIDGCLGRSENTMIPDRHLASHGFRPVDLDPQHVVVHVAAGPTCCGLVCSHGDVFTWGAGDSGALGLGDRDERLSPTRVLGFGRERRAVSIAMSTHTVVVVRGGALAVWGANRCGQLGLGHCADATLPRTPHFEGARMVACGHRVTAVLDGNGRISTCGSNTCGELGHGEASRATACVSVLTRVTGVPAAVLVAAGASDLLAVTTTGAVYSWGMHCTGGVGRHAFDMAVRGPMLQRTEAFTPVQLELPVLVGNDTYLDADKMLAVAMGMDARLGEQSLLRTLPVDVLRRVLAVCEENPY